ncbi:MAG: hypothetical protein ABJA67_16515 [Chthonomonadales bacterium]
MTADFFLRRLAKKYCRDGIIHFDAFKCEPDCVEDGTGLSIHKRLAPLDTESGVEEYQAKGKMPSGDLLGVCQISSVSIPASCPPVHKPEDLSTDPYGNHHYELLPCPDEVAMTHLANFAILLLPYKRSK